MLAAGTVIGSRYRLERLVAGDSVALWRAGDLTLSRPVAVRVLVGADPAVRRALHVSAARAAAVHDPRIAATYDADDDELPGGPVSYLVREWVTGEPLRRLVTDGGVDPQRVGALLQDAADGLAALHAGGGWHGRVHPDNVLVQGDGRVRLTDPWTGAALAAAAGGAPPAAAAPPPEIPAAALADLGLGPRPEDPGDDPGLIRRVQQYDTCDLARTVYAAAAGCWPGGPWRGLPAAPQEDGRPLAPRQVRAAVPRDLDAAVTATLPCAGRSQAAPAPDATSLAGALAAATTAAGPPEAPRPRRRTSPWVWRGVALAVLAVIGAVGWSLGLSIGKVPGTTQTVPSFTPTPGASAGPGAPGAAIPLHVVSAFDPPPGDGQENDNEIPLAYDGSPATSWQTQTYATARFGNLKTGVGLLVDLGTPTRVAQVQLVFDGTPTGVELRASDTRGAAAADFPVVAQAQQAGQTITLTANQTRRYWLVWITSLPKVAGGYRAGIAEMVFRS